MKKIVLFLHGYGSNGSDLITLKDYFHFNPSETEFISPNAPEPCEFNYFGYQWFALNERSVEEIQTGLKSAFFYLDDIVNDIKKKFEINTDQISILGFSQGSMLATYYALQNESTFQNIFSLSGSLPNQILEKITDYNTSAEFCNLFVTLYSSTLLHFYAFKKWKYFYAEVKGSEPKSKLLVMSYHETFIYVCKS